MNRGWFEFRFGIRFGFGLVQVEGSGLVRGPVRYVSAFCTVSIRFILVFGTRSFGLVWGSVRFGVCFDSKFR